MQKEPSALPYPDIWEKKISLLSGKSLAEMSSETPVMLIFLRHFGCSFCREAMADVSKKRKKIENLGARIVFVHMAPKTEVAEKFFRKFKLYPIDHIADPEKQLYRAFNLGRGTPAQLFGLMNWIRGFEAGVIEGHGFDYHNDEIGDGFQMPGIFVLHQGDIKHAYVHEHAWDRPDYEAIVKQAVR